MKAIAALRLITSFASVGEVLTYNYVVTNAGNVSVTNTITISDDKIPSVTCQPLPAGGLAPAETLNCSADYNVTQADIDAGGVTNIASASDGTTTSDPDTVTVPADIIEGLSIVKRALSEDFSMVGDIVASCVRFSPASCDDMYS